MKILISILLISLSLLARSNPFESTDTYKEKRDQLLQAEKNKQNHIVNTQELIQNQENTFEKLNNIKNYNNKILPFVNIITNLNSITINVKQKYKLINQDIDLENKKLIFDFKGVTNFYTKREQLKHAYFKSITIGCHKKKEYFRIVIELKNNIMHYQDIIDTKRNAVTIKYIHN